MVHLNRVATDVEVEEAKSVVESFGSFKLDGIDEEDDFTATVYGSKYAAEDLPRHAMPEKEMPPQV